MTTRPMRKASREMSKEFAIEVLRKAPFVTVSFQLPEGGSYGIPLSLAAKDDVTWYFHCAKEGQKLDCIKSDNRVCLSAVTKCKPTVGPKDDSFTLEFKSAVAFGTAEIVENDEEKIEALRLICERFLPQNMHNFDMAIQRSLAHTCVVKITLTDDPTGKRKQYDKNGDEMKYQRME